MYAVFVRQTIFLNQMESTVCKACIMIWQGRLGRFLLHYIPYSLVVPKLQVRIEAIVLIKLTGKPDIYICIYIYMNIVQCMALGPWDDTNIMCGPAGTELSSSSSAQIYCRIVNNYFDRRSHTCQPREAIDWWWRRDQTTNDDIYNPFKS